MRCETEPTEAKRQYDAAYTAHYSGRDLPLAAKIYRQLLASYPDSLEARYAQSQLRNIIRAVVPTQELQDAQMNLLLAHFKHDGRPDAVETSLAPTVSG